MPKPPLALLPMFSYDELTVLLVGLARVDFEYAEVGDLAESADLLELVAEVRSIAGSLRTAVAEARYLAERPEGGVLEALRLAWE